MIYSFPGGIFGFANLKVSEIVVLKSTQKGLLGYEKHPKYLGRAFENTCAEVKNKDLVCAKK